MWLSLFGFGRKASEVEPVTLKQVKALNVRLELLEGMRADVGPQLRPEQVQKLIAAARRAALEMRDRFGDLSAHEREQFERLRVNLNASLARERQYCAERAGEAVTPQGRALSATERAQFEGKCTQFRLNQKMCPETRRRTDLTERDRREIETVCARYPDFVRELLQNEALHKKFFSWALRSGATIDVFVQFPRLTEQLMNCHADKRFGVLRQHTPDDSGLRVRGSRVEMKVHGGIAGTGCVEGSRYVPLHDPKLRVALTNLVDKTAPPYIITVGEILRQLQGKKEGYGNIEVLRVGVANWNTIQLGSYNPLTKMIARMDPKRWMTDAPPIAIVTHEEIEARFPGQKVTKGGVKFCVCMSRQYQDSDYGPRVDNNHGFITVFIPDGEGRYRELNIGLQPDFLPKNIVQMLWLIGATELAKVHIIDESRYLVGDMIEGGLREHRGIVFNLTEEEAEGLKKFIAQEIQKGHDGKKIFSPQGNNCANWVQKAFWRIFVDPLLLQPIKKVLKGHRNQNLLEYFRALERSTKASNDDALQFYAKRVIRNLGRSETIVVIRACHTFLAKTLFKDNQNDLLEVDYDRLERVDLGELRNAAQELLIETLMSTQFFRMRIREADASIAPFNWLNQGLNWLLKKSIISERVIKVCYQIINFVLFGSWRFTVFSTEKGVRFKSLYTSKYHQAGTLPLPVGMKGWIELAPRKRYNLIRCITSIRGLRKIGRRCSA